MTNVFRDEIYQNAHALIMSTEHRHISKLRKENKPAASNTWTTLESGPYKAMDTPEVGRGEDIELMF